MSDLLKTWVYYALKNPIDDDQLAHAKATKAVMDKLAIAVEALCKGLDFVKQVKDQVSCPPAEIDSFEESARAALAKIRGME